MRTFRIFTASFLLLSAVTLGAQNAPRGNTPTAPRGATSPAAASAVPRLRGRVTDSSGAVIPGASVKVMQGNRVVAQALTGATGDFDLEVSAGEYQLEVRTPDFKTFQQNVRVAAGMAPLSIAMAIAAVAETVDVTDSANRDVNIDAASGLSAQTIAGDQLQDLPDNEDDLAAYLLQLAGASGAAGSQATFVVDGFNGGRLPPRDQIQQIIIDNNPFTAEGNGGTRITIITRPGTGKWTGQFGGNFNSSAFNAATPAALTKPAKRQKTFNTTFGGPIIQKILAVTFTGQNSQTDAEGNAIRAVLPAGQSVNQGVLAPSTRRNLGARGQMYMTKTHTLNFNTTYGTNNSKNQGTGGFTLPERASNTNGHNWQVQLSDRAIPNTKVINELRFQAGETDSNTLPVTNAISINVTGAFNSGGGQNSSATRNRTYEVGNTLRWTITPKVNLQTGIEGIYEKRHSSSQSNLLGTYTFASLDDYVAGRPQTFTKTSGNPLLDSAQFDLNIFVQADWRAAQKMNIGLGARYIAQTNLKDDNNLAPTVSAAIQASKTTVIRAGSRLSYQGFSQNNTETLLRNDGTTRQSTLNIAFPTYLAGQIPPEAVKAIAGGINTGSIYVRSSNLRSPYNINSQVSLEQGLPGGWKLSTTFDTTKGEHLIRARNINAPFPGTALGDALLDRLNSIDPAVKTGARAEVDRLRPYYPVVGNLYQFESSASASSKNVTIRLNTPAAGLPGTPGTLYLGHFGFGGSFAYTRGYSNDDLGTAPNQYDFSSEWARSQNDQRNRIQAQFQMRPTATVGLMSFNITSGSGRPYNFTTGKDNNGDQSSTDRPAGVGRNTLTSPSTYNVDLNWTKIHPLRNGSRTASPANNFAEPPQGGGGGDGSVAGAVVRANGGTQVGRVNFSGPRITWNFSVRNLLNNTQVRGVSGVQTSPLFGKATSFAAGRTITAGLTFNF